MRNMKKISVIAIIGILLTIIFQTFSYASTPMNSANLVTVQESENHLQYNKDGQWSYAITTYVGYSMNGKIYPAYCLDSTKPGVNEVGDYTVNIDRVIDREDVWRVIINGFPYKSASELGLETDLDAFVSTKLAVYCILYDWNPDTFYRHDGPDSRGIAIANCISSLVNIGKNGSQTRQNVNLNINKIGDFQKDGSNYYQEYSVSSAVRMENYSITSLLNAPSGAYSADTSGSQKTTFASGENFRVYIPASELTKDIDITILLASKCETYPVLYGTAPNGSWQDYAITYDPLEDIGGQATLNISTNTAKIKIVKTDSETGDKIEGVTFELLDSNKQIVDTKTTNSDGIVEFENLYAGSYTLREKETNDRYILDVTNKDVSLNFDETKTVNWTNDIKRGNIKVYKVDSENHKVALGDVQFDLYSEELDKIIGSYTTDVNGEIKIDNLRVGKYKLIEKTTNKWYNLAKDTEVEVKGDTTTDAIVYNELKKGKIKVIKVDKDNNEIKLKGVKFNVLDEDGNILETIITDENGEALTKEYAIRDFEKLILQEIETLKEYKLNTQKESIELKANEIVDVIFENEIKKGKIKIIKVDKDNNEIKLEGVTFEVLDEDGKVVQTLITDENGECETDWLPISVKYTVRETKTKQEYNLNNESVEVELEEDKITSLTFENELKKGRIKVIKVDKDNNEIKLKGVKFNVLDEDGNILETIITDENGEALTKEYAIRDFEKLILQEIETLKEYKLNTQKESIELKANEIVDVIFENEIKKGKIKIIKVDKDNNEIKLEGVTFEVLDEDGKVVQTLITDENGECETDWLPINKKYTVRETITKNEYVLNDKTVEVELEEDKITNLTFENEIKKGQIKVFKTDGETKTPLKDIEFEVYNSKGELVDKLKTDENGEATSKKLSIFEEYTIVETKTRKGYILNTEEVNEVELKENEITNIEFENFKGKGTLKIVKTSSNGVLKGFRFLVKGTTYTGEEYEEEFVTNDEGIILIEDLLEGKYTITEIRDELSGLYEEVPSQEIKIKNDETTTVNFYNKLIEVPNTGDNSYTGKDIARILIVSVFIIIILTFVYVFFGKSKNKDKNTYDKK